MQSLQYQIVLISNHPASIKAVKEALDARAFHVLAVGTTTELRARPHEAPDLIILDTSASSGTAGPTEAKGYLHVYAYRLRQKIEPDPAQPRYLLSVPGVGYRFARAELDAASDSSPTAAQPLEATPPVPLPPTSLIGRAAEMAQARRLLGEARVPLLTLTGAGGSGKTRLAQELAHELHPLYDDGVVFVALADLTARQVFVTVAQALSLALPERAPLIAALGVACATIACASWGVTGGLIVRWQLALGLVGLALIGCGLLRLARPLSSKRE